MLLPGYFALALVPAALGLTILVRAVWMHNIPMALSAVGMCVMAAGLITDAVLGGRWLTQGSNVGFEVYGGVAMVVCAVLARAKRHIHKPPRSDATKLHTVKTVNPTEAGPLPP